MHVSDPELCLWHAVVCIVTMPPSLGMLPVSVSSPGCLLILSFPLDMVTGFFTFLCYCDQNTPNEQSGGEIYLDSCLWVVQSMVVCHPSLEQGTVAASTHAEESHHLMADQKAAERTEVNGTKHSERESMQSLWP